MERKELYHGNLRKDVFEHMLRKLTNCLQTIRTVLPTLSVKSTIDVVVQGDTIHNQLVILLVFRFVLFLT